MVELPKGVTFVQKYNEASILYHYQDWTGDRMELEWTVSGEFWMVRTKPGFWVVMPDDLLKWMAEYNPKTHHPTSCHK